MSERFEVRFGLETFVYFADFVKQFSDFTFGYRLFLPNCKIRRGGRDNQDIDRFDF